MYKIYYKIEGIIGVDLALSETALKNGGLFSSALFAVLS